MKEKLTPGEKQRLVARYQPGETVKALCKEVGVSKSSFYERIRLYREIKTLSAQVMTPQEFEFLWRVQKLEAMLTVLKSAGCTVSAPLQEKRKELPHRFGIIQHYSQTVCRRNFSVASHFAIPSSSADIRPSTASFSSRPRTRMYCNSFFRLIMPCAP